MTDLENQAPFQAGLLSRPLVAALLVAAVAATVVFVRLGATTLDEHESKAALAGRAILGGPWLTPTADGEKLPPDTPLNRWLVPVNNGRPRLVKTPLPYWVMATVGMIRGGVDEWTARIPPAAETVLCALVVLALGRRMFGPRVGLLGALIFATSLGVMTEGRNARPEMLLCLFMTVSMACFWQGLAAPTGRGRTGWMIAFWAAMGLANCSKQAVPLLLGLPLLAFLFWRHSFERGERADADGRRSDLKPLAIYLLLAAAGMAVSVAITVLNLKWWAPLKLGDTVGALATMTLLILLPLAWYAAATGGWRQIRPLLPTAIPGVVLMLLLFLPWMIYMRMLFAGAGEVFDEQLTERAAGTGKWSYDSPMKYVGGILQLTLPWLALLPGALAVAWMKRFRARRPALMYLTLWCVLFVALLNLSAGKRAHYLLPMLPALSLLMAFAADDLFFSHRWLGARSGKMTAIGYAAVSAVLVGLTWLVLGISQDTHWAAWLAGQKWLAWMMGDQAKLADLLADFADHSAGWRSIAIAAGIAVVPLAAMLVLAVKNKLAPAMGLLTAAVVIVYVGHVIGGHDWDSRSHFQLYARESDRLARGLPLYSWNDPQCKLVFYLGRNIPSVQSKGKRGNARQEEDPQWQEWVKNPANVAYVFCYGKQRPKLEALGYTVEFQVEEREDRNSPFLLMRNSRLPSGGAP